MAKSKVIKKASKIKAKPAKTVKVDKKTDKKSVKKPIAKAALATLQKAKKAIVSAVVKKTDTKPAKAPPKAEVKPEKNNAKAQISTVAKPLAKESAKPVSTKATKTDAKSKGKTKKVEKKAEEEFEDDLIGDDFGDSEIAEYEDDLKAVEDDEDDTTIELSDDDDEDKKDEEIYLTDSEGRRLCKVRDCDQAANVDEYCRFHYLLLWKKIQIRKSILTENKLETYVIALTTRYPDKFIEVLRKDLKTEKDFISVIQELELDENAVSEAEGDDEVQSFSDEIRGIGETTGLDDDSDF